MQAIRKIFNPSVMRGLKLLVMGDVLAAIFLHGVSLPNSSRLQGMFFSEAHADTVTAIRIEAPEIPLMLVPVLIILTVTSLYYIRKNMLAANA